MAHITLLLLLLLLLQLLLPCTFMQLPELTTFIDSDWPSMATAAHTHTYTVWHILSSHGLYPHTHTHTHTHTRTHSPVQLVSSVGHTVIIEATLFSCLLQTAVALQTASSATSASHRYQFSCQSADCTAEDALTRWCPSGSPPPQW